MHNIYTTKGFIVNSLNQGEANKFINIFTQDFGMVGAVAQGIRLSKSKLKYHIEDGSLVKVSLVRGKEVWRLIGAEQIHKKINKVNLKVLNLLKRLLHGEEMNENLFEIIEGLYMFEAEDIDFELLECLSVIRILNNLGYIREITQLKEILSNNKYDKDMLNLVAKYKTDIIKIINEAFKQSHL